jgi:hypothetical protein
MCRRCPVFAFALQLRKKYGTPHPPKVRVAEKRQLGTIHCFDMAAFQQAASTSLSTRVYLGKLRETWVNPRSAQVDCV